MRHDILTNNEGFLDLNPVLSGYKNCDKSHFLVLQYATIGLSILLFQALIFLKSKTKSIESPRRNVCHSAICGNLLRSRCRHPLELYLDRLYHNRKHYLKTFRCNKMSRSRGCSALYRRFCFNGSAPDKRVKCF